MSENRFKLHIEWSNINKTDGIAELSDNGQPLLETECIEDARLLQTILNELNEENQRLKNDCSILIQSNQEYRKENEQLKKRLEHYKEVEAMNGDGKNEWCARFRSD